MGIGMAVTLALEMAKLIPVAIDAGKDVAGAVSAIKEVHESPDAPSDARWAELDAAVKANKAAFEAAAKD